jgi:5-formyltetrahydrofolate cyclo-ligase
MFWLKPFQRRIAISSLNHLRQSMRRRRQAMGIGAQKRAAHQLARRVLQTDIYQKSQHIAFYWALNGEIELRFLIKKAWTQGKHCYLPVIDGQRLRFVRYMPASSMGLNRFGIPEPHCGRPIAPDNLDLVLVPLLAFDRHHHRIGMGGGFYDRTFASRVKRESQAQFVPYLMGVAHRCQQVQQITPAPWDVILDQVLTDS